VTALDVQRLPGAGGFVLGNDIRILGRRAHRGHVAQARRCAADVEERQPDGASYRRVRVRAGTESVVPGVDAELARHRAVDDDERRAGMGGRLHAVEIHGLLAHRLQREEVQREVLRLAARHDGVCREPHRRRLPVARGDLRYRLLPWPVAPREHRFHARGGRRHDRQPVSPAAVGDERVDRVEVVVGLDGRARCLEEFPKIAHFCPCCPLPFTPDA